MSEPDFEPPANAADDWPYGPPGGIRYAYPRDDAMPGDDTLPYGEWHHDSALPGEPGGYGAPQELEAPPEWPGGGMYMPGQEDQPAWSDPYLPTPHRPASHRRNRRSARRSFMVATLLLAAVAAGAGAALLRSGTMRLSPSANPEASATSGLGVATGAGHGKPGLHSAAEQPPAITRAEAERVVFRYWQVNNQANESYSASLLATIESGSSYSMDTGAYRFERDSQDRTEYVPFRLGDTSYYIPRLPRSAYPRWFTVRGTYVTLSGGKILGSTYIVFAQDFAGAAWKDIIESDILPGSAPPQIVTDSGGYATAVSATGDTAGLSVAPNKIGLVTAAWLDKVAADPSNTTVLADAGNLTDLRYEAFWRSGQGGAPFDANDSHSAPADPVFGLKTADGGALLFYTTAAQLTLTPPDGGAISSLNIPGHYPSSSTGLTSATVGYIEQFATYAPAAGHNGRRIVADISSIASRARQTRPWTGRPRSR